MQQYEDFKEESAETKRKSPGKGCLIVIAVIIFLALVVPTDWVHTGSECKICHRTYTDASNMNYIFHTKMCKKCYLVFCVESGMTPKNYDK